MSSSSDSDAPELYKLTLSESWVKVVQRVTKEPSEAKYVCPNTKLTCLHVAVRARKTLNPSSRIAAIRALLEAYPEATTLQDSEFEQTPLAYACLVDDMKSLDDDSEAVRLMVELNPKSSQLTSKHGYSPLELHIMAMSRLKRRGDALGIRRSKKGARDATFILKALLKGEHTTTTIAKALDTLFECNSLAVLEQVALEDSLASTLRLRARRRARMSGASVENTIDGTTNFANFWVWQWALILLEADYTRRYVNISPSPPFLAMHAAAQVKDCPLPFLSLAMRAYPSQVRQVDERTGNLPLHFVAAWDVSDPSTISRKSMALNSLLSEYPQAGSVRNRRGKTPMSLSLESGTSWDNGVRRLTSFRKEGSVSFMGQSMKSMRSMR
jgi:hypothetical protein